MRIRNAVFCFLIGVLSNSARAEDCPAFKEWFGRRAPTPSNSEPKRGNDCAFYQRAWQTFLFVTDSIHGSPRLLSYKTYHEIFKSNREAEIMGALLGQGKLLFLPRVVKTANPTSADDFTQASRDILLDTAGHPIFYSTFLNPTFSNFIIKKGYNKLPKILAAPPEEELPIGAAEFKAAWQIVEDHNPPTDRIVISGQVPWLVDAGEGKLKVDLSRPPRAVRVALIGLHVVLRTKGHPEMIWSTFEYDWNAPSMKGNPPRDKTNCVNTKEPVDNTVDDGGKSYLLFSPQHNVVNQPPDSIAVKDDAEQIFEADPKTSIARVFPYSSCSPARAEDQAVTKIDKAIETLNTHVKAQIADSKRKSYSLVGGVWLDDPGNPNENRGFLQGRSFEDFELGGENRMSSTAMESFTQILRPHCFGCHNTKASMPHGKLGAKRLNVSHVFRRFAE